MVARMDLSAAERRVLALLPTEAQAALTDGIPASDLQTLLLAVARARAGSVRPADVLRRWQQDRFVRPATTDPRVFGAVEARLWELLPAEVDAVELSPVVPLGSCSALGPVSQNRVLTTMRGTEVLSDATNALAIEAAVRRRESEAVHLAASHRHLRTQRFGAGMSAHFRLFALVSSARDTGSAATEARLLTLHLDYWRRVLAALVPTAAPALRYTVFGGRAVRDRLHDTVLPALAGSGDTVPVVEEPDRDRGRGYYTDVALRLTAASGDTTVELGDGGFTRWTARLTNNAKERCLVSCVSLDGLVQLRSA